MANEPLLEKIKTQSKLRYSAQALAVLGAMKDDFPLEDFEAFAQKNFFTIGGQHILLFLEAIEAQKKAMRQKLNPLGKEIPNEQL